MFEIFNEESNERPNEQKNRQSNEQQNTQPNEQQNEEQPDCLNCPCCGTSTQLLIEYLNHICSCQDNCKRMDIFFDEPPPKKDCLRCPCCGKESEPLSEYLLHHCSCKENCRRMEIFFDKEPVIQDAPSTRATPKELKRKVKCAKCRRHYSSEQRLRSHQRVCGSISLLNPRNPSFSSPFKLIHSAFRRHFRVFSQQMSDMVDIDIVKRHQKAKVKDLLQHNLDDLGPIKFYLILKVYFQKMSMIELIEAEIPSTMKPLLPGDNINNEIEETFTEMKEIIDQYTERGSGFTIVDISKIDVWIAHYQPHRGGCHQNKLPAELVSKHCLLSIKCQTDCFMYSILAALHQRENHPDNYHQYDQFTNSHDFSKWRGQVELNMVESFEKKNAISISVFTYNTTNKFVIPLYITKNQFTSHVRLFLYNEHYYLITNFARLLNSKSNYRRYHCERCLNGWHYEFQLKKHMIDCSAKPAQKIVMPYPTPYKPRRNFCERSNLKKEIKHPIIIYCDFECLIVPTNDPLKPFHHEPCSYGYIVVDWDRKIIDKKFDHGENIVSKFLTHLKQSIESALDYLKTSLKPLKMSPNEEATFQSTTNCWICEKPLDDDRVRDHDHLTGKFRGAAHNACNVNYSIPNRIPIFFHNLKNYDGHLLIDSIKCNTFTGNLKLIPSSMEKYIGWYVDNLAFLDSFAFLPGSLDTLSSNLSNTEKEEFLRQEWPGHDLTDLMGKASIPYEYLSSLDKFEDQALPPMSAFYSSLNDTNISQEMYDRLKRIWRQFNCRNLGQLIDIYLRLDVLMLAAVFENFRKTSIDDFGIDPPHYMTCPGLSYAAALKMTKISIELFLELDMLLFIEGDIRGGFTTVAKRHAIANNPSTNYDGGQQTWLMYFDVNNLYGNAMMDMLPIGQYKWVNFSNEDKLLEHIMNTPDDGDIGYILEIDLEYPKELHDAHNDFPLAPHKMKVTHEMLSPYAKKLYDELEKQGLKPVPSEKLVSTFLTRRRYSVHFRNLKFYIENGLKVAKVHRVISFKQKAWLKPYIQFCTKKRQEAKTTFTSSLYKLFVNSIYGKLMEDKRKHIEVKLAMGERVATKRIANPLATRFKIIDEDKMLIQLKPECVLMDKAIVSGFTVLELSKLHVYKLYYGRFKKYYGDKVQLVYSDTDSFLLEIKSNNIITDMKQFNDIMDFGDLPNDHPLYSSENKKKIGCLKDEMSGEVIHEVIAVKPKLYCIKSQSGEKKRAKGVQKNVVKNKINFEDYKNCLYNEKIHK
ncbi:uncharacterized protein LOC107371803 [Tetranychus urticae]|uniref:uncharacterized protein LOC107371803 n=1 Tax=Tetranychus urticae TaxID=32264 RepID=UPI00077BE7D8|nr:uncharacterized protein LOC107371803 [Tetranychus urticae]